MVAGTTKRLTADERGLLWDALAEVPQPSVSDIAGRLDVCIATVYVWRTRFDNAWTREQFVTGGDFGKRLTAEERGLLWDALAEVPQLLLGDIAGRFDVSVTTVKKWKARRKKDGWTRVDFVAGRKAAINPAVQQEQPTHSAAPPSPAPDDPNLWRLQNMLTVPQDEKTIRALASGPLPAWASAAALGNEGAHGRQDDKAACPAREEVGPCAPRQPEAAPSQHAYDAPREANAPATPQQQHQHQQKKLEEQPPAKASFAPEELHHPLVRTFFPDGVTLRTMTPELISQRDAFVQRAAASDDVLVTSHGDFVFIWEAVDDEGCEGGEGDEEGRPTDAKRRAETDHPATQAGKRPKHASA